MAERAPKKNGKLAAEGNEQQSSGAADTVQHRKANLGCFGAPGRDAREAAAKSAEVRSGTGDAASDEFDPGPIEQEEGMPDLLAEMRHVYSRPAAADVTQGQRVCREWIHDNISAFMAAKSKLECDFLEWKRDQTLPAVAEESAPDEPVEMLIGLLQERLRARRWLKKEGQ